ncbi:myeloid leukemia factor isoform X2 [Folsomia candida]|uniref:myeloid leukemia factor isoform X2 n=1 Tax=Folsomia candida TaxID=158441 RepID=UPI000B8FF461|nr:myeloid leukemia factor isoform X2 [Folsomia candida]
MSLFGSLMRDLERDPVFGAMNQMNRMMNSMMGGGLGMGMAPPGMGGPMGGMGMLESPFGFGPHMGIPQGHPGNHSRSPHHPHEMMPFVGGGIMSPFGHLGMGGGFPDFNQLIHDGNNGHSFSSMSVTSISNGPNGPQVYQASKQTASGPGGVKETRKAVSDTRTGTKKLAVGRHVGERAHVREREENMFTGRREENEEFINLEEEEAEDFDREWKNRAYGGRYSHSSSMPAIVGAEHTSRHHNNRAGGRHLQIGYPTRPSESTPSVTIEELPPSDDEDVGRSTETPKSTASMPSASSSRRSPYTREKKQKSKRVKKY